MRILFMGNNWVGWQVAAWLHQHGAEVVGAVLHPSDRQKYGAELRRCFEEWGVPIFDGATLRTPSTLGAIRALNADLGLSVFFGYILKPAFLGIFPQGVLNLHPSYLPYNKGAHPNVWSIVEGTPAGVTLHFIDEGVDTGDLVARLLVPVESVDTAATLYRKLEIASVDLFATQWPQMVALQNSVKSFKRAAPREQLANGPDMIGQICGHGRGGLER
jgi:methionyl-tRNA formyltransferase